MSSLVQESWAVEVGSREPWCENSRLIQPLQDAQITLHEFANSLAVQTFLRMCGLDHTVEQRSNSESISPTGNLPVLQCGSFIVAEIEPIIGFVSSKGINLNTQLDAAQSADLKAYFSLVSAVLGNAELFLSWLTDEGYNVTYERYGSVYPWPLNKVLPYKKRRAVTVQLRDWSHKSVDEVVDEVNTCCNALSERLADNEFFFGSKPTELDALVFGHLFALVSAHNMCPGATQLVKLVNSFDNLRRFCTNIEKRYFAGALR